MTIDASLTSLPTSFWGAILFHFYFSGSLPIFSSQLLGLKVPCQFSLQSDDNVGAVTTIRTKDEA